jgi:proline iminopeptidase
MNVNGCRFHTATTGAGSPVVLLHGGPGHYDDLEPVAAMLEDRFTVHRFDQRGCGRSDRTVPYTLDQYLADLDGLRAAWGHDNWVVGGHSWGANLALAYALRYPQRVKALLYLAGPGLTQKWHEEYRANRKAKLSPAEWERFLELRRLLRTPGAADPADLPALDAEYVHLYRCTDYADRRNVPPTDQGAPQGNYEVNALLNADWERFASTDTADDLRAVKCPALFVHGVADPRPAWAPRRIAEAIPGAGFVELPGVGHYLWQEEPTRLREALRAFL